MPGCIPRLFASQQCQLQVNTTGYAAYRPLQKTQEIPDTVSRTRLYAETLHDIENLLPELEHKLQKRKEHGFSGVSSFHILRAVIESDNHRGLNIGYYADPKALARQITNVQKAMHETAPPAYMQGVLSVGKARHHVAVVAHVTKSGTGVLILESIPDLKTVVRRRFRPWATRVINAGMQKSFPEVTDYENIVVKALDDIPNLSVYYTYLGTQASMTDCAAFALYSSRIIARKTQEQQRYVDLLANRKMHVALGRQVVESAPFRRVIAGEARNGCSPNTHFILDGKAVMTPYHYIYTQRRRVLEAYCRQSPVANPEEKTVLKKIFHEQAAPIIPKANPLARFFPRLRPLANIGIREVQIAAIRETQDFLKNSLQHPQANPD